MRPIYITFAPYFLSARRMAHAAGLLSLRQCKDSVKRRQYKKCLLILNVYVGIAPKT